MSIYLSSEHFSALKKHCEECSPEEACALLIGVPFGDDEYQVTSVALSKNIAADQSRFFEIDPGLRIKLEKELRNERETIIGVFHSHPNGPAEPSKHDERMIIERHLVWLIAAVNDSKITQLNAFVPREKYGFSPIPLNIQNG